MFTREVHGVFSLSQSKQHFPPNKNPFIVFPLNSSDWRSQFNTDVDDRFRISDLLLTNSVMGSPVMGAYEILYCCTGPSAWSQPMLMVLVVVSKTRMFLGPARGTETHAENLTLFKNVRLTLVEQNFHCKDRTHMFFLSHRVPDPLRRHTRPTRSLSTVYPGWADPVKRCWRCQKR